MALIDHPAREPKLRRWLSRHWPQLLGNIAVVLFVAAYWFFVRPAGPPSWVVYLGSLIGAFFGFGRAQAQKGADDLEDRLLHPPSQYVCLLFPSKRKVPPLLGDLLAVLTTGGLVFCVWKLGPPVSALAWAAMALPLFLILFCLAATFRREPTHRRRCISRTEYDLARAKIDPALSVSENLKVLRAYTWGDKRKARDIVLAALGRTPATPEIASPYPR